MVFSFDPPALPPIDYDGMATYASTPVDELEGYGESAAPLPGPWANGREFGFAVLGVLLAVMAVRFVVRKTCGRNKKFQKIELKPNKESQEPEPETQRGHGLL